MTRLPKGFRQKLEQAFINASFTYNYAYLAEIAIREFRKVNK